LAVSPPAGGFTSDTLGGFVGSRGGLVMRRSSRDGKGGVVATVMVAEPMAISEMT
jgi:hypothetical protein